MEAASPGWTWEDAVRSGQAERGGGARSALTEAVGLSEAECGPGVQPAGQQPLPLFLCSPLQRPCQGHSFSCWGFCYLQSTVVPK